ncbi:hypothetical protein HZH66_001089 [Vespula vulgaris]|uniref:Uncharacterized protein n=1 Tax=Vespula vulgaris TaxID=7454 RepID=A0A834KSS6_VESVU|nr:hypothetical protein HZH66_001089 [Vespula vulgaris]
MLMKIVEMLENHNSTTSGPSIDATFCQNARTCFFVYSAYKEVGGTIKVDLSERSNVFPAPRRETFGKGSRRVLRNPMFPSRFPPREFRA